jgi:hypothetical protein
MQIRFCLNGTVWTDQINVHEDCEDIVARVWHFFSKVRRLSTAYQKEFTGVSAEINETNYIQYTYEENELCDKLSDEDEGCGTRAHSHLFVRTRLLRKHLKRLVEFFLDVEPFQINTLYVYKCLKCEDSAQTLNLPLRPPFGTKYQSGIKVLKLQNVDDSALGSDPWVPWIAWIPHHDLPHSKKRGCFALAGYHIRLILPSVSSVIDWLMLTTFLVYPVNLRVPLAQCYGQHHEKVKKVLICIKTEKLLRTFLRVLLVQFSEYNGLKSDRLGPDFQKQLITHTQQGDSEPLSYNLERLCLRKNEHFDYANF